MPERAAVPTVLAEDERVRVTRWDFAPGASTGWHRHGHPYAVIPMTECRFLLLEPGELSGASRWRRGLPTHGRQGWSMNPSTAATQR